jgi:hypothetical protein
MGETDRLRRLAAWYREMAERAGDPWVWEARLKTAIEMEREAARLERNPAKIERPRVLPDA